MTLPKSSTKPNRRKLFLLRQVAGTSMLPHLQSGRIVMAVGWFRGLRPYDIVIINHGGFEKIKRIHKIVRGKIYVRGDNQAESIDSRHFGWIDTTCVLAKVVWPRLRVSPELLASLE